MHPVIYQQSFDVNVNHIDWNVKTQANRFNLTNFSSEQFSHCHTISDVVDTTTLLKSLFIQRPYANLNELNLVINKLNTLVLQSHSRCMDLILTLHTDHPDYDFKNPYEDTILDRRCENKATLTYQNVDQHGHANLYQQLDHIHTLYSYQEAYNTQYQNTTKYWSKNKSLNPFPYFWLMDHPHSWKASGYSYHGKD